jgi:hypothetical protein
MHSGVRDSGLCLGKVTMAHSLRSASWRRPTPASDLCSIPGYIPAGSEAFPVAMRALAALLPKAVDWVPVPKAQHIAGDSLGNAGTFLPTVLHGGTRAFFSFQGAVEIFSQRRAQVEMHEMQGLKPRTPTYWVFRPVACGGLKPLCVNARLLPVTLKTQWLFLA